MVLRNCHIFLPFMSEQRRGARAPMEASRSRKNGGAQCPWGCYLMGTPGRSTSMGLSHAWNPLTLTRHGLLCNDFVGQPELEKSARTKEVMSSHDFP